MAPASSRSLAHQVLAADDDTTPAQSRTARHCSRRFRAFSIMVSNLARKAVASVAILRTGDAPACGPSGDVIFVDVT
jgi:hypothetical protein